MNKIIRRTTPFYILLLSSAIHAATLDLSLENITEITREYITKKLDERKIPYTQFTDIKLPISVTKIGDCAFQQYNYLTRIDAPNVETIGQWAFQGCQALKTVNVPKAKEIGRWAFLSCNEQLKTIISKRSIQELKNHIISTLDIPVDTLEELVGHIGLQKTTQISNTPILRITSASHDIDWDDWGTPRQLRWDKDKINSLINNTPTQNIRLTPEEIRKILSYNPALALTTFRPTTLDLEYRNFEIQTSLFNISNKLIIKQGIQSVTQELVRQCLEYLSEELDNCPNQPQKYFQEIVLPDSVKCIEANAFEGFTALKTINLGKVEQIGSAAFKGCINLSEVNLSSLKTIENETFMGCRNLQIASMENVETISDKAFMGCTNLENVSIENIENIGIMAFMGCTNLQTASMENVETISDKAFMGCTNISISKDKIKSIGDRAFKDCPNLTYPELPKGITIGSDAFDHQYWCAIY